MTYSPINVGAYTSAFAGAIAGMAVSGWITDPLSADYSDVVTIAGAFAESFDLVWNDATTLNNLEQAAITTVVQEDFTSRGPGPFKSTQFKNPANWTVTATACAALILECDAFFAGQGINPGTGGAGVPLSNVRYVDGGTATPLGNQNGAIGSPFATIQQGIDSCPANGTVLVTFGTYAEDITVGKNLTIQKTGLPTAGIANSFSPSVGGNVSVQKVTVSAGNSLQLNGINHTKLIGEDNTVYISIALCTGSGADGTAVSNEGGATYPTINAVSSTLFGTMNVNFFQATNALLDGNINIGGGPQAQSQQCCFINCAFPEAKTLTFDSGGPNVLTMDPVSNANFQGIMTLLATVGTYIINVIGSDVSQERLTPVVVTAGGAGGYSILPNEGGEPMIFDASVTGQHLLQNEKLEVGIDATQTDGTTIVHTELRANRTYAMIAGVLTQINDSTVFTPAVVAGNPTIKIDLTANVLSLQVYQAAAGGHNNSYVGSLYFKRTVVS
jgi:hypothetical protein